MNTGKPIPFLADQKKNCYVKKIHSELRKISKCIVLLRPVAQLYGQVRMFWNQCFEGTSIATCYAQTNYNLWALHKVQATKPYHLAHQLHKFSNATSVAASGPTIWASTYVLESTHYKRLPLNLNHPAAGHELL